MRFRSRLKKIGLAVLGLVITYASIVLVLRGVGLENAQDWIQHTGFWSPVVFVIICAVSLIIAPLSGSSFFIIGGTLFGKEPAFFLSFLGSLIGCSVNFWISRKLGRRVAHRLVSQDHLDKLDRFMNQLKSHHSIFYIALIMPLSQDVVSYAVGLTKVKYVHFFIALFFSTAAIVAAYIYIGTSLLEAIL
jgi:uncharacterized membrane protein YdjX (TVP38/TMEM64 family)